MSSAKPATVISKAYAIINDPATDHLIRWDHDGTTFTVFNPERLAADVFPSVFNHASYPSFTRALNAYGFRQVARNKWKHPDFRRGHVDALDSIQRRRIGKRQQQAPRASAPGAGAEGTPRVEQPRSSFELLGFSAQGCMQLIEAQKSSLDQLRFEVERLHSDLVAARREELQMQSTVAGVLGVLVQEYGRQAIESALGGSLESFLQYANTQGMHRAASEWLQNHQNSSKPMITYRPDDSDEASGGKHGAGRAAGQPAAAGAAAAHATPGGGGVAGHGARVPDLVSLLGALGMEPNAAGAASAAGGRGSEVGGAAGASSAAAAGAIPAGAHAGMAASHAPLGNSRFEEIQEPVESMRRRAADTSGDVIMDNRGASASGGGAAGAAGAAGSASGAPSGGVAGAGASGAEVGGAELQLSPDADGSQNPTQLIERLLANIAGPMVGAPTVPPMRASRVNSAELFEELTGELSPGSGVAGSGGAHGRGSTLRDNQVDVDDLSSLTLDDIVSPELLAGRESPAGSSGSAGKQPAAGSGR